LADLPAGERERLVGLGGVAGVGRRGGCGRGAGGPGGAALAAAVLLGVLLGLLPFGLLLGEFGGLAGGLLLLLLLDRRQPGLLLGGQLRHQLARVGQLALDGRLGRLQVVLRLGERGQALGRLLALHHLLV